MDDSDPGPVRDAVDLCLRKLGDGSLPLANYRLDDDTFEVTGRRELDDGYVRFEFSCEGTFSASTAASGTDERNTEEVAVAGHVVLDDEGKLVVDDDGCVRFGPWRVSDPRTWSVEDQAELSSTWVQQHKREIAGDRANERTRAIGPDRWFDTEEGRVARTVQVCLRNATEWDIHSAADDFEPEHFEITDQWPDENRTRYEFALQQPAREPTVEQTVPFGDRPTPDDLDVVKRWLVEGVPDHVWAELESDEEREPITGTIVLDAEDEFVRSPDGGVLITGFDVKPPHTWLVSDRHELPRDWPEHPDAWRDRVRNGAGGEWDGEPGRPDDPASKVEVAVLDSVRDCLAHGLGDSGHLGHVDVSDLSVVGMKDVGGGLIAYEFHGAGGLQTEFSGPVPSDDVLALDERDVFGGQSVTVAGTIVLDRNFELTYDDRGRVRVTEDTLHPRFWEEDRDNDSQWDSPLPGAFNRELHAELSNGVNPLLWRPGAQLVADLAARLRWRGEAVVIMDPACDDGTQVEAFEDTMQKLSLAVDIHHDIELDDQHFTYPAVIFTRRNGRDCS